MYDSFCSWQSPLFPSDAARHVGEASKDGADTEEAAGTSHIAFLPQSDSGGAVKTFEDSSFSLLVLPESFVSLGCNQRRCLDC